MDAIHFEQANHTLKGNGDNVSDLPCFYGKNAQDQPVIVSCFKLTKEELEKINETGVIWLHVLGSTQPPVAIDVENPFE